MVSSIPSNGDKKKESITLQVKTFGARKPHKVNREINIIWRDGWMYFKVYLTIHQKGIEIGIFLQNL